jgi:hypothetical protein
LNPNASKTEVLTIEEFQARRHRNVNMRIDAAKRDGQGAALGAVIDGWFALNRKETPSWDKVVRKIYSIARQLRCESLRDRAVRDSKTPILARAITDCCV